MGNVRLHVVFNNTTYDKRLKSAWGFAAFIETPDLNILFDTGRNGSILLSNLRRMNLSPKAVDFLVISHGHNDHTGGLEAILEHNPDVSVYLPASKSGSLGKKIKHGQIRLIAVLGPEEIGPGVYTTGEMGRGIGEQALILDTTEGLVVVTGCAHPGIANMVERARNYLGRDVYLVIGGFHLANSSKKVIQDVIERLNVLGVRKVAPSHCAGKRAIKLFKDSWRDNFIEGGVGAVIELPELQD